METTKFSCKLILVQLCVSLLLIVLLVFGYRYDLLDRSAIFYILSLICLLFAGFHMGDLILHKDRFKDSENTNIKKQKIIKIIVLFGLSSLTLYEAILG